MTVAHPPDGLAAAQRSRGRTARAALYELVDDGILVRPAPGWLAAAS